MGGGELKRVCEELRAGGQSGRERECNRFGRKTNEIESRITARFIEYFWYKQLTSFISAIYRQLALKYGHSLLAIPTAVQRL